MEKMEAMNGKLCSCGKVHSFDAQVISGSGVLAGLPGVLARLACKRPFLLADDNTFSAAGQQVQALLQGQNIPFSGYTFPAGEVKPDENAVGAAVMHFDHNCDGIVGIGSGVINDIGKILAAMTGLPYVIVATAPSMDGYASATSSMTRDGLKISLPSKGADVILGDTQILKTAPDEMLRAGLGDILAKYVSICEWRIANLITGEYFCPEIAQLVRDVVQRCCQQADGLLQRQEKAVQAVFEGLVISGVAMNYAGLSRPASGVEHYISHILDMRAVEFGTPERLHGIQCAVGTLLAVKEYEKLKKITPDPEKALAYAAAFHYEAWARQLRYLLGKGAQSMIALEAKEGKYEISGHKTRLERICDNWQTILDIVEEELPTVQALEQLLDKIGAPKTLSQLGTDDKLFPVIFRATGDIRDKYVLSRLVWDLGLAEEFV